MLVRIVKMEFKESFTQQFKLLFEETKPLIAAFDGCFEVKLLQDETNSNMFFTISKWKNASSLANYRNSTLFKTTWAKVKPNFSTKADAWSMFEIQN